MVTQITPAVLEIDGLCQMLNIGKNTAYNLLVNEEIQAFKVGSVWKIPMGSVYAYINSKCQPPQANDKLKLYTVVNYDRDLYFERHHSIPSIVLD